ncbi:hypothetical protein ILYODFUR_022616 [Ilyodon furcidens]|uniref:Uncharacterized protein n=1 Tax=Ilyodon furcidens TaxID=33524 RepID=A0ABV0SNU3_9TELE
MGSNWFCLFRVRSGSGFSSSDQAKTPSGSRGSCVEPEMDRIDLFSDWNKLPDSIPGNIESQLRHSSTQKVICNLQQRDGKGPLPQTAKPKQNTITPRRFPHRHEQKHREKTGRLSNHL